MTDLIRKSDALAAAKGFIGAETAIAALPAVTVGVKPDRETFDAMCAMRDAINEFIPMPSLESDLLQGPENSVFCATVAEAVIAEIRRLRAALEPVAAPDPAAIREAALHWFAWSFQSGNTQASVYIGYPDKTLPIKRIVEAKVAATVPETAVLTAVSYLGFMTPEVMKGAADDR